MFLQDMLKFRFNLWHLNQWHFRCESDLSQPVWPLNRNVTSWRVTTGLRRYNSLPAELHQACFGLYLALVWPLFGTGLVFIWSWFGLYLVLFWPLFGLYLTLVWSLFGPALAFIWPLLSPCLAPVVLYVTCRCFFSFFRMLFIVDIISPVWFKSAELLLNLKLVVWEIKRITINKKIPFMLQLISVLIFDQRI